MVQKGAALARGRELSASCLGVLSAFPGRMFLAGVLKQFMGDLSSGFCADITLRTCELLTTDLAFQSHGSRWSPLHGIRMPQTEGRNLSRPDSKSKQMSKNATRDCPRSQRWQGANGEPTPEERRELGRKAGKASVRAREALVEMDLVTILGLLVVVAIFMAFALLRKRR